jgi:hypothetical protein
MVIGMRRAATVDFGVNPLLVAVVAAWSTP